MSTAIFSSPACNALPDALLPDLRLHFRGHGRTDAPALILTHPLASHRLAHHRQ
jgi:hypothetical protein